jgi:hypothetical protein
MTNKWIEAYDEVIAEIAPSGLPTIEQEMKRIGVFPQEALYLGTCTDGLPSLFNVKDPVASNVLFLSDDIDLGDIEKFSRLTPRIRRADFEFARITNQDLYASVGWQKIHALATWVHGGKGNVVVLIDDFENVLKQDFEVLQNMTYILLRGAKRNVHVLARSSNPLDAIWSEHFCSTIRQTGFRSFEYVSGKEVISYWMPEIGE